MTSKNTVSMTLASGAAAVAAGGTDDAAVEKALETLKTYDWGADRNALKPIDEAITAAQGDAAALKPIEMRLLAAIAKGISRSALDYVCRKLRVIGTNRSVAVLASLLADEETSHIARYALERIPGEKAAQALREALPKVGNKLKPGMIGSLGTRRDEESIGAIAKCLGDSDVQVAQAAAQSLGLIGTAGAAKELTDFAKTAPAGMKMPVADACLVCAERLLADGEKSEALVLYRRLRSDDQPAQVRVAAMRGMLAGTTAR